MFCSYVDGDPYQTVTATLVRLFLNISVRFYALHCGIFDSQLSMDLCPFHFFRRKTRTIGRCLCLVQTFNGAAIFTRCSLDTNGLQLNHTHSMSDELRSYSMTRVSAAVRTMKILQYFHHFL